MKTQSLNLLSVLCPSREHWRISRSKLRSGLWLLPLTLTACTGSESSEKVSTVGQAVTAQSSAVSPAALGWGSRKQLSYPQTLAAQKASATASPKTERTVWVMMKEKPAMAAAIADKDWKGRGKKVHAALKSGAASSQASLVSYLSTKNIAHKSFWIANTVRIKADAATIAVIAKRSDVAKVIEDGVYYIPPVTRSSLAIVPQAIEWNIQNVRAPEVWDAFGSKGEGIVIATIDTGVDYTHPAVANQYRGLAADGTYNHDYSWYDPSKVCDSPSTQPCDNAGHGTHTMGTIVGDDGGINQIGVAPGAKWIAAKGCEDFSCSYEALLSSGQWMLAPTDINGENPRTDMRPHIVSNSWGGGSGDEFYREIVANWVAAGIFPVFANGNSGPSCGSANSPGDYPESYGVGAYDDSLGIANFSGRGPALLGGIKPNIAAPGVSIRSAIPGGGYDYYDGTSMATPHVAGAVALMWSASASLTGDVATTRSLLDESAIDQDDASCGGTATNNNTWGEGMLDAYRAVELSPRGPTGVITGTVAETSGSPIAGARLALEGPLKRTGYTASDGSYRFKAPVGFYGINASAFSFYSQMAQNIEVVQDGTTTQSFALEAAPSYPVSGTVLDEEGEAVAGATVTIASTPLASVVTDASGAFSFASVPAGDYQVIVDAGGCLEVVAQALVVDGTENIPVTMTSRTDEYGYTCRLAPFDYIPGTKPVSLTGQGATTKISLPFPFMFYGRRYDTAIVSTGGYLSFSGASQYFDNLPIPDPMEPNATLFGYWDDNYMDERSSAATAVIGTAPNRKFVMEWRDVAVNYDLSKRNTFEVVISENGEVVFQYLSLDGLGSSATIGIEDATGTIGHQYSYNQNVLTDGLSVRYLIAHAGVIDGIVTDANDGLPIVDGEVTATDSFGKSRVTTTDSQGRYAFQIAEGSYSLSITKRNYAAETISASVVEGATATQNFSLETARAEVSATAYSMVVPTNSVRSRTFALSNTGSRPLTFEVEESGGKRQAVAGTARLLPLPIVDPNALTTKNLYDSTTPPKGWNATDVGDTLFSFYPTGMALAWGVGVSTDLWLSDASSQENRSFSQRGVPTGTFWSTPWAGYFPGDMAYDSSRNLVCQVAVGNDNGIHCWDPATGLEVDTIAGSFAWTLESQRGLAYRSDDDSFYIGGWNEGVIYHVQGLSGAEPGAVISSCAPSDGTIAGLAYNDAMGVLWASTNSETDTIYQLNPEDCSVLSTLRFPQGGGYQGAGLEMDAEGSLWAMAQSPNKAYLIDSGVPAFSDVPWLSVTPASGAVAASGAKNLSVVVNTQGLEAGVYTASIIVASDSGRTPLIRIPVSVVVSAYQQGINIGGVAISDANGDGWAKDQAWTSGAWGYMQKGSVKTTKKTISGTTEQSLFQSQRVDPYAYRFDSVPNGIYEVDFRFAEFDNLTMGKRLYDVIVENATVLPAHDIVYDAGKLAADAHKVFVEVADNRMDVRFIPRAGYKPPVINALRVTHRPDR